MEERRGDHSRTEAEQADERYRRLIERSRVGLFQTGRDGRVLWVNQAAADIVGFESPHMFIAEIQDIRQIYVDPARREEFERAVETGGRVTGFEYEIHRNDGSIRWISVSATPMTALDGSIEGFEGSVVDVTESKLIQAAAAAISSELEPQESVSRFAEVLRRVVPFQQLTLAVIEDDRYRRVVSIHSQPGFQPLPAGEWVPLAGNSVSAVIETKRPVVNQDTEEGRWEFDRRLREAGVGSYATFPLMDGSEVFASFNVGMAEKNAFDDQVVELLGKHTSAVAQAVKNILLFEAQRAVVERLTELDRLKNEFFAEASHDLRHPLTVILGISQMLAKDWGHYDEARKREFIGMIAKNAQSMSDLLARDLEVALIESGELSYQMEPFDLTVVIQDAMSSFASVNPDRELALEGPSVLPTVFGDPRRQDQVLQNLLSNAGKFSPPGTPIRIVTAATDDEVSVSVIDEGPGIGDEHRDRLFQRLSRLERKTPGTGLGLYITRSMVEAQGGRIWVDPAPGGGACFTYTVPCAGEH